MPTTSSSTSASASSSTAASSSLTARANPGYGSRYGAGSLDDHVSAYVSDDDLFPEFFDEEDSDISDSSNCSSPCGSPPAQIMPTMSMSIRSSQTNRDLASTAKVGEKTLGKKKVVVVGRKVFSSRKGTRSGSKGRMNMSPIAECGE
jgi:hypothetical protein